MESQSTMIDSNKAKALRSTSDRRAVPRQSSSTAQWPDSSHRQEPLLPAQFLPKSGASGQGSGNLISSPSGSTTNLLTPLGHSTGIEAPDSITDSTLAGRCDSYPVGLHFREGSGNARTAKASIRADAFQADEDHLLPPHSSHVYPPSQSATLPEQAANLLYHDSRDQSPISAPTVFSRHAAPLSLPQLDEYISSLLPPAFSSSSRTQASMNKDMFMPLDRLSATGRSIESLEMNYKVKPAWRKCSSSLGGVVNVVLGVTVSSVHSGASSLLDAS
jgi:hypothetical protein